MEIKESNLIIRETIFNAIKIICESINNFYGVNVTKMNCSKDY